MTVRRRQMAEILALVRPAQHFMQPTQDLIAHDLWQSIEARRVDQITQRIFEESFFQINLAQRSLLVIENPTLGELGGEVGTAAQLPLRCGLVSQKSR